MTLLKGREVEQFLAKPDPSAIGTLIFGPEEGLVSESAEALLASYVKSGAEAVRLSAETYKSTGAHIENLLKTDSLFSPRQVFYVEDAGAELSRHLKELDPSLLEETAHRFIVVAGDLKKTSALRAEFEKARHYRAIVCYVEGEKELLGYTTDHLKAAGLESQPEDRVYLISLLSNNRLVNRGELDKLVLYCHGQTSISREDIDAVLGDVGLARVEEVLDLAMVGNRAKLSAELSRFNVMGVAEELIFASLSRHLDQLYNAKLAEARGSAGEEALRAGFGYVHFSRKTTLLAQLRQWSINGMEEGLSGLSDLEKSLRLEPDLKQSHLERYLLRLATLAKIR